MKLIEITGCTATIHLSNGRDDFGTIEHNIGAPYAQMTLCELVKEVMKGYTKGENCGSKLEKITLTFKHGISDDHLIDIDNIEDDDDD